MDNPSLTQRGITAQKAGDREKARELLRQAVAENPQDVNAWLWLSGAEETDEARLECMEAILRVDAQHKVARPAAELLRKKLGYPELKPQPPVISEEVPLATPEPAVQEPVLSEAEEDVSKIPTESVSPVMPFEPAPRRSLTSVFLDDEEESPPTPVTPTPVPIAAPVDIHQPTAPVFLETPASPELPKGKRRGKKPKSVPAERVSPFTEQPVELTEEDSPRKGLSVVGKVLLIILGVLLLGLVIISGYYLVLQPDVFWGVVGQIIAPVSRYLGIE
ncbi:MAG TPA: hypothetical protein VIO61_03470 [Anaerolineaceae bacterium]